MLITTLDPVTGENLYNVQGYFIKIAYRYLLPPVSQLLRFTKYSKSCSLALVHSGLRIYIKLLGVAVQSLKN